MRRADRGQITLMTLGFLVFLGLLAVVVVNASQAFLEHRELDNLADGAALTAADVLDEEAFYAGGEVRADTRLAARAVTAYVAGGDAQVVDMTTDDGTITVTLRRDVDLAFVPPGFPSRTSLVSEATSQLRAGD